MQALLIITLLVSSSWANPLAYPATTPTKRDASPHRPVPGFHSIGKRLTSNPTESCYNYEVLDTRGKSNAYLNPADLLPTVQGILAGYPGGNYWENPYGTGTAQADGKDNLISYINHKTDICPASKFIMVAFSYGTQVTTQALNNATMNTANLVGIIFYGNGYWTPGRVENQGTATTTTRQGFVASSGIRVPTALEPITRDYCVLNDWECQSYTMPTANTPNDPHHSYVNSTYQDQAVSFAVHQLTISIGLPTASQSVIKAKKRMQQTVMGDSSVCGQGYSCCPSRASANVWECLSTHSALEHCGGCPGRGSSIAGYGVDCTSLEGATDVSCVEGICQISACEDEYVWMNGTSCARS